MMSVALCLKGSISSCPPILMGRWKRGGPARVSTNHQGRFSGPDLLLTYLASLHGLLQLLTVGCHRQTAINRRAQRLICG